MAKIGHFWTIFGTKMTKNRPKNGISRLGSAKSRVPRGGGGILGHFLTVGLKMGRSASNFIKNLIKIDWLDMIFHDG